MKTILSIWSMVLLCSISFAQSAVVSASSMKNNSGEFKPAHVLDGDLETHWISTSTDSQLLKIALSNRMKIKTLEVVWAKNYAVDYTMKISSNGKNWMTVYTKKNKQDASLDLIEVKKNFKVKYIIFVFFKASNSAGYSISEVKINGQMYQGDSSSGASKIPPKNSPAKEIPLNPNENQQEPPKKEKKPSTKYYI
jgi:hypothetical protein